MLSTKSNIKQQLIVPPFFVSQKAEWARAGGGRVGLPLFTGGVYLVQHTFWVGVIHLNHDWTAYILDFDAGTAWIGEHGERLSHRDVS